MCTPTSITRTPTGRYSWQKSGTLAPNEKWEFPRQIVCLLSSSGIKSLLFCGPMLRSFWLYSFSVQRGSCDGDSVWENIHLRCEDSQFKLDFHRTFPFLLMFRIPVSTKQIVSGQEFHTSGWAVLQEKKIKMRVLAYLLPMRNHDITDKMAGISSEKMKESAYKYPKVRFYTELNFIKSLFRVFALFISRWASLFLSKQMKHSGYPNQTYLVYVVCYFEHSGLHSPDAAKLLVLKKKGRFKCVNSTWNIILLCLMETWHHYC